MKTLFIISFFSAIGLVLFFLYQLPPPPPGSCGPAAEIASAVMKSKGC